MRLSNLRMTILMIYNSRLNSAEKSVMICIAAHGTDVASKQIDIEIISQAVSLSRSVVDKILIDLNRIGYVLTSYIEKNGKNYTHFSLTDKITTEYSQVNEIKSCKRIKKGESFLNPKTLAYKDE